MKKLILVLVAAGMSAQTTPEIPDKALSEYWKAVATFWAAKANLSEAEKSLETARRTIIDICGKDATVDENASHPVCKSNKPAPTK